jgi:hypothetical protein
VPYLVQAFAYRANFFIFFFVPAPQTGQAFGGIAQPRVAPAQSGHVMFLLSTSGANPRLAW